MRAPTLGISVLALCGSCALASPSYSLVQGIDKFDGSDSAWRLLETNGFVVADPAYKYIFEPYLDNSLPPFVTIDSAWETYQVLLASGLKQLESSNQLGSDFFGSVGAKIPREAKASALDFFVASPELCSPAASRALRQLSGENVERAVENLNCALPSDSIASQALRLLASVQKPVPDRLAPVFHSQAWADEQLWTQLGAWTEQGVPRPLHDKIARVEELIEDSSKEGAVAPYPDFFSGLAQLSRDTGAAMEKAGMDEPFDTRTVGQKLLSDIFIQQSLDADERGQTATISPERLQFGQFATHYMQKHHAGGADNSPAGVQMFNDLEALAHRCVAGGVTSLADLATLHLFYDERMTAPRLLQEFAATCDRLAELARKQADGTPITEADAEWIANYGRTLMRFHYFPEVSASEAPGDFPIARRLGADAAGASVLWAGLGRPEALYIILPSQRRLRLYRGAVLSFREFFRPGSTPPAQAGNLPPPPDFTASFRAQESAADILEILAAEAGDGRADDNVQEKIDMLQSRASDPDLPALIGLLARDKVMFGGSPISAGIASVIEKLNWNPFQKELLALIDTDDGAHAAAVASILLKHPEWLDSAFLSANFDKNSTRSRRVYALLLGHAAPTDQTRAALLKALRDEAPGVRWQAVLALGDLSWDLSQKTPPLLERLDDTNDFVAAAAARGLGKISATAAAPILFSNLQQRLQAREPKGMALQEQRAPVLDFALYAFHDPNPFDSDNLLDGGRMAPMMRFPGEIRRERFTLVTALIESLGDLHYQPAAEALLGLLAGQNAIAAANALAKIAPDKLVLHLTSVAADKNAVPQTRNDALVLLGSAAHGNPIAGLIPLLDDQTVVPGNRPMAGREWRICDQTAATLAALMGRDVHLAPAMPTEQRDEQIEQVRQWLKSAY